MTLSVRAQIALLFYTTANIIIFTAAVYAAALFPPLTPNAGLWIAAFTGAGLLLTAPVAWCLGACFPRAWRKTILAERSPLASRPSRTV